MALTARRNAGPGNRSRCDPGVAAGLERAYCKTHRDPLPHLAARFAAKEATSKALGTGMSQGVGWKDIEVLQPGGRVPELRFSGAALERFQSMGCARSHLTLSHDGGIAIACVVLEDGA